MSIMKIRIYLLLLLLLSLLTACGTTNNDNISTDLPTLPENNVSDSQNTFSSDNTITSEPIQSPEQSEPAQPEQSESDNNDLSSAQSAPPAQSATQNPQTEAYAAALEGLYYDHIYPNGDSLPPSADGSYSDLGLNQFAVYDIDSDGEDELLFLYSNTDFSKMTLLVYRYDTDFPGSLMVELFERPDTTFYEIGMVQTATSTGEESDTYLFYSYSPISDTYEYIASVESWNKTLSPDDFPDEADADGDGIVYRHYVGTNAQIIDGSAYQELLNSWIGGVAAVKIPYQAFTPENIATLQ